MLRRTLLAGLCALVLDAGAAAAGDKVVSFANDDATMNAAIEKARGKLPVFWARFAAPARGEENFLLKIRITDGDSGEHFWCAEVEGNAEKSTCVIANEPQTVSTVKYGERITVNSDDISDWMFYRDGRIIGAQTIRVMLPHLSEEEAAPLQAALGADE